MQIEYKPGKVRMSAALMTSFFKETIDSITSHVYEILHMPESQGVDTIVMVGGFSESPLLFSAIRSNFCNIRVIIQKDAGLAVLKGAVIFGHFPAMINERVSKYTYGIITNDIFDPSIHDPQRQVVGEDRQLRCSDIFSKLVEVGQPMVVDEVQKENLYSPAFSTQTVFHLEVYVTKNKNPLYVTDAGCHKIGYFEIPVSGYGLQRPVKVRAKFGGTEIFFDCIEVATGKVTRLDIDFLSS